MKFYVIKIVKDGKMGYLNGLNLFGQPPIVLEATNAYKFFLPDDLEDLKYILKTVTYPGRKGWEVGLTLDKEPEIVEIETFWKEIDNMNLQRNILMKLISNIMIAKEVSKDSWLNEERFKWFLEGYRYASSQTLAIPTLAAIDPEDLYFAVSAILRGARKAKVEIPNL